MKKFVCAVLALVMLLAIAASASASDMPDYAEFKINNVPCEAIDDTQLYNYHGDNYVGKDTTDHIVQIKHRVTQINADENNRIAAYRKDTGKTMGAGWKPADGAYYPINSNAIVSGFSYTAAGRGNTNYASKYGINRITITGTINAYDD